jgi:hypothetical protein
VKARPIWPHDQATYFIWFNNLKNVLYDVFILRIAWIAIFGDQYVAHIYLYLGVSILRFFSLTFFGFLFVCFDPEEAQVVLFFDCWIIVEQNRKVEERLLFFGLI